MRQRKPQFWKYHETSRRGILKRDVGVIASCLGVRSRPADNLIVHNADSLMVDSTNVDKNNERCVFPKKRLARTVPTDAVSILRIASGYNLSMRCRSIPVHEGRWLVDAPSQLDEDFNVSDTREVVPALRIAMQEAINASLWENSVPVIDELVFDNDTDESYPAVEITVSSTPPFLAPRCWRLQQIGGRQLRALNDRDVALDGPLLAAQSEASRAVITFVAQAGETELVRVTRDVRVLARNEWGGLSGIPDILAAFVLPNDPAVARILRSASDILQEAGQSPSLEGYQGDKTRVWAQAQALWCAICGLNITYINPPPSFVDQGQRIRLPSQVLEERLATCLDTTVLFAACLEAIGLRPLIVLTRGHAFAGLWLSHQDAGASIVQDLRGIRNRLKLDDLRVFETTLVTSPQKPGFVVACERGESTLRNIDDDDEEEFREIIDIHRARLRRIRPLSTPIASSESTDDVTAQSTSDQPTFDAPPILREDREEERSVDRPVDRVQRWCNRLLDMSARNRLLNLPRSDRQLIELDCPDPARLEDMIAEMRAGAKVKPFRIISAPGLMDEDDPRNKALHQDRHHEDAARAYALEALERRELVVQRRDDKLQTGLLEVYRQSRASEQEGGTNVLFLTIGAVAWTPEEKSRPYLAPLILVPVILERASIKSPFTLRAHGDESRINTTLLEMLRSDYDIRIPLLEGDTLPEDESGLDIIRIIETFRVHLRHIPGWEIRDHVSLTTLSFSKFLMWKDLLERREQLNVNDVAGRLLNGHKSPDENGQRASISFEVSDDLDAALADANLVCPMEADSTQLKAVARAAAGENFVLIGPPGTGKSQTIGNIIANTLAQGRTVLFVAEKRTALEVVRARLAKLGIAEFCLDLFSPKANKMEVLQQFQTAQTVLEQFDIGEYERSKQSLDATRLELNAYVRDLHKEWRNGWTPYRGIGACMHAQEASLVLIPLVWPHADIHTRADYDALVQAAEDLATLYERIGNVVTSPRLAGLGQTDWSPLWENRLLEAVKLALGTMEALDRDARDTISALALDTGNMSLDRLGSIDVLCAQLLGPDLAGWAFDDTAQDVRDAVFAQQEVIARHASITELLAPRWKESIHTLPVADLLNEWQGTKEKWLLSRSMAQKALRKRLEPHAIAMPEDCEADLVAMVERSALVAQLDAAPHAAQIGALWSGLSTNFGRIDAALAWGQKTRSCVGASVAGTAALLSARAHLRILLGEGRDLLAPGGSVHATLTRFRSSYAALGAALTALDACSASDTRALAASPDPAWLSTMQATLRGWQEAARELRDWCSWRRASHQASQLGLTPLVEGVEQGIVARCDVVAVFEGNYARWWTMHAVTDSAILSGFVAATHEGRIIRFRELDEKLKSLSTRLIRTQLAGRIPGEAARQSDPEYKVLTREMAKKARHLPVRQLAEKMPGALRTLTPCLMMSPLSVAQYLPTGAEPFDLVIFDEASQIATWDAIGAIGRGRQVIVVGDPKQLPPTDFFASGKAADDGDPSDEMTDLDSILDECLGAGIPAITLGWHYRSRHESLIAFSNQAYYGGDLVTFPSPVTSDQAVSFRYVSKGIYEPGRNGSHTNPTEARMVVAEALRIMRDGGDRSIGVVTFNGEQQKLIVDLLEAEIRKDPALERFTGEAVPEPLLVKNLENVQGEERDVMLFSLTYGPDVTGKISMNFGPLNRDGGERRLNVAITRAREQLIVFGSLRGDQIAVERTQAVGVRDLRRFLTFAERGAAALAGIHEGSVGGFDSVFEVEVATMLRAKGWGITTQVGVSGFRVDLGVIDPDLPTTFLAGVECDGATYHRSATARDRDRLRQAVLENLGWNIIRIWSTDWWSNAPREVERVDQALGVFLEKARQVRVERAAREAIEARTILAEPSDIPREAPSPTSHVEPVKGNEPSLEIEAPAIVIREPQFLYAKAPDEVVASRPIDGPVLADAARFMNEDYLPTLGALIAQTIDTERVLREDLLIRAVSRAHGFGRATREIQERIQRAIPASVHRSVEDIGAFLWSATLPSYTSVSFDTFSGSGSVDPATIPMAALIDLASCATATSCSDEDTIIRMRDACGMSRMGQGTRARFTMALTQARSTGGDKV
jgi:very-short-patch-repair endonuclease